MWEPDIQWSVWPTVWLVEKQNKQWHEDVKPSPFRKADGFFSPVTCLWAGGWDRLLAEGLLSFAWPCQMSQILKWGAGGCSFTVKVAINFWIWWLFHKSSFSDTMIICVIRLLFFSLFFFFPLHPFLVLSIFFLLKASTDRSASMCNQSISKWVISLESLSSYTNKYYNILKTPSTVSINKYKWYKIASSKLPFEAISKAVACITAVCRKIQLCT